MSFESEQTLYFGGGYHHWLAQTFFGGLYGAKNLSVREWQELCLIRIANYYEESHWQNPEIFFWLTYIFFKKAFGTTKMTDSQNSEWFASWCLSRGMNTQSKILCDLPVKENYLSASPSVHLHSFFTCSQWEAWGAVNFLTGFLHEKTEIGRVGTQSQASLLQIVFSFHCTIKWKIFLNWCFRPQSWASQKHGYLDLIMETILYYEWSPRATGGTFRLLTR